MIYWHNSKENNDVFYKCNYNESYMLYLLFIYTGILG